MGSPKDEPGRLDEDARETQQYRRIDRSIAVATKEVTWAQYLEFNKYYRQSLRYGPEPDCPANYVDWPDVAAYCNWLSQQAGIPVSQWCYPALIEPGKLVCENALGRYGYRLPTEAEWEYSARAGSTTARSFGDSEDLLPRYGWTWLNSSDHTWPVGQLLPNELGLFDMLGNVWEWCHDGTVSDDANHYPEYPKGMLLHPAPDRDFTPPLVSGIAYRFLRGGAFDYAPAQARCAHRYKVNTSLKEGTIGFRVVRTIPLAESDQ
jgi:eukaryotic-like serine/threonine-protein kinase